MKRDFFRTPNLVRLLKPGEELAVTEHGKTDFVVVKSGRPAQRTTEDLARLAAHLLPGSSGENQCRREITSHARMKRLPVELSVDLRGY